MVALKKFKKIFKYKNKFAIIKIEKLLRGDKMKSVVFILVVAMAILGTAETIKVQNSVTEKVEKIQQIENEENNIDDATTVIVEDDETDEEDLVGAIEVNDETFEKEVLNSKKLVLVDFWASWCNPCQRLMPIIEEVAIENPNIKVVTVNIDDAKLTKTDYEIKSIPTLMIIQNGEIKTKSTGYVSKEVIENMIAENL